MSASGWIKRIAVVGGGMIGSSWATNFLWKGLPVNIRDVSATALEAAGKRMRDNMGYLVSKGIITVDQMQAAQSLGRIDHEA